MPDWPDAEIALSPTKVNLSGYLKMVGNSFLFARLQQPYLLWPRPAEYTEVFSVVQVAIVGIVRGALMRRIGAFHVVQPKRQLSRLSVRGYFDVRELDIFAVANKEPSGRQGRTSSVPDMRLLFPPVGG